LCALSVASFAGTWSDDFSQNSLGSFWSNNTNAFWISNGVLHGESASPITPSPFEIVELGKNWSNYSVSVFVNIIAPNTRVCTKGAILLRHSGNEGYVFALHEPTQTIELYRLSDHEMLLSKPAAINFKQWYRLRAELQDDEISLWVDENFIGKVNDARSPSGSVGLAVQDTEETQFDHFTITGPEIPDSGVVLTWTDTFSENSIDPVWSGDTNAFSATNNTLLGVSASTGAMIGPLNSLEIGYAWNDYTISCSVNILRPDIHRCTKGALILRHSGDDGYVFALHEATQTIEFYRLSTHEMLLSKPAVLNLTNWYRLRAEALANTFYLYVDDRFIGAVTNNKVSPGAIGIAVQDADVLFDDFTLTASVSDQPRQFMLHMTVDQSGTTNFGLSDGAMISHGQWYLEVSHDLNSWERLTPFSPGNVTAFAQDTPPPGDLRPRFYRAILLPG
jgi:hypothetical protein